MIWIKTNLEHRSISFRTRGGRYPIWFNSVFEFCRKMIHIQFNIALPKIQFKYYSIPKKKSADSIQKIIQFNCQRIIDTGWLGKVPKNCSKSVQNRQKKGGFSSKIANSDSKYDSLIYFTVKFNSKNYSISFFHEYSIQEIIQ